MSTALPDDSLSDHWQALSWLPPMLAFLLLPIAAPAAIALARSRAESRAATTTAG